MTLLLPTSPRFAEDTYGVSLSASLVNVTYGLRAWTVTLEYDSRAFALSSYSISDIWADAIVQPRPGSLQVGPASAALTGCM